MHSRDSITSKLSTRHRLSRFRTGLATVNVNYDDCIALIVVMFAVIYTLNDAQASDSELDFERCSVVVQAQEVDALCASLKRPENPADPSSRLIDLSVVKFPSHSPEPEDDAFTIIQGGPGASSIDLAVNYRQAFDHIRRKRDILVIDQRGTGRSNRLGCDTPENSAQQFDIDQVVKLSKECATELSAENDLRYYTSSIAVDDIEAMRLAAGYSKLNLYGVSYGTRVVQHYLRKYPDGARTAILDGVVPVGLNLAGGEVARRWEDSFDHLNARCQNDQACKQAHGDLRAGYQELNARFIAEPLTVTVPDPLTAKPTDYTFTEHSLFAAIRLMAYSTEQAAVMPSLISEAKKGNYTFAASQLIYLDQSFADQFAGGMHNSVVCAEDAPFVTEQERAKADGTLLGQLMSDMLLAACKVWPQGVLDDDFNEPFESDIPVLVLSGETDPITPPANGDKAAEMFSNSKHIVVPAHGHGVLARGCVPMLASIFIKNATFEEVDATCTERERPMPIFTTLMGPQA